MGLFWDLLQQSQISRQGERTASVETRLSYLESELRRTQELMRDVIQRLEQKVGADLDRDGRIG